MHLWCLLLTDSKKTFSSNTIATFGYHLLPQINRYANWKCLRKTDLYTRIRTLSVKGLRFPAHNFRRIMKTNGLSRHIGRINSILDTTVRSHGWISTGRESWKIMFIFLSQELTDLLYKVIALPFTVITVESTSS